MDNRFANIFNLTEERAIALIKKPLEELEDKSERYVAASHLINFPTERSINALIETIEDNNPDLYHKIARRKAVESLGKLKVKRALPIVKNCLSDSDSYTVENAVWAIGEIGTTDESILEEITSLLDKPEQNYRLIIQTIAKFNYQEALEKINSFLNSDDETIVSAAIAAVATLSNDRSQMNKVVEFLQHTNVNARRLSIQDLIDTGYYSSIPAIAKSPISIAFRLRGIRLLGSKGINSEKITFKEIESSLEKVIFDRPQDLEMVHEYDLKPSLEFLIRELYQTDFGRCYLATQTILTEYREEAILPLMKNYNEEGANDYGANYHLIKLFGWLKYEPAKDIIIEALNNKLPQYQKSRAAATIALGELEARDTIPLLKENLNTKIFDLKYATLLTLEKLGENNIWSSVTEEDSFLIQEKAKQFKIDR